MPGHTETSHLPVVTAGKEDASRQFQTWFSTQGVLDYLIFSDGLLLPTPSSANAPCVGYGFSIHHNGSPALRAHVRSEVFDAEAVGAFVGLQAALSHTTARVLPGARITVCLDNAAAIAGLRGGSSKSSQAAFLGF